LHLGQLPIDFFEYTVLNQGEVCLLLDTVLPPLDTTTATVHGTVHSIENNGFFFNAKINLSWQSPTGIGAKIYQASTDNLGQYQIQVPAGCYELIVYGNDFPRYEDHFVELGSSEQRQIDFQIDQFKFKRTRSDLNPMSINLRY